MNLRFFALISLFAVSALADPMTPLFANHDHAQSLVRGRALLKLSGVSADTVTGVSKAQNRAKIQSALAALAKEADIEIGFSRPSVFGWMLVDISRDGSLPSEVETERMVAELAGQKLVASVSTDRVLHAMRAPNDPGYEFQWHLPIINAEEAWDITVGNPSTVVAVIDSGAPPAHEEFENNTLPGFDFVSDADAANDGSGRDADPTDRASNCPGGADDGSGFHGTHVAGTIAAATNNGVGVAGVNWNAKILHARALGCGGGFTSDIVEATAWAAGFSVPGAPANANPARVMNLSLGGPAAEPCSAFENDTFQAIADAGGIVVVAAGNDGNDIGVGSPANCRSTIAVGAFGPDATLASYSQVGPELDIYAPGGEQSLAPEAGVLSTVGFDRASYEFYQGTSMATPHVTGAISLALGLAPNATLNQIVTALHDSPITCFDCNNVSMLMLDDFVARFVDADPGPPPTNNGGGNNTPVAPPSTSASCDPARGNWDCDDGSGCVEGRCVRGADSGDSVGALCEENDDCNGGLCDRGVCTKPCDFDCEDGYSCDEDRIPGGLCVAKSCKKSRSGICDGDFYCTYSEAERYVCATDGEPAFACTQSSPSGLLVMLVPLLALALRRRVPHSKLNTD